MEPGTEYVVPLPAGQSTPPVDVAVADADVDVTVEPVVTVVVAVADTEELVVLLIVLLVVLLPEPPEPVACDELFFDWLTPTPTPMQIPSSTTAATANNPQNHRF